MCKLFFNNDCNEKVGALEQEIEWKNGIIKDYAHSNIALENQIVSLKETIKTFEANEPKQDTNENYWNEKYPSENVKYSCRRVIKDEGVLFSVDVRYFFMNSLCSELQDIVKSVKDKTNDEKMIFCQNWVKNNIGYVSDSILYKVTEYWADALETLKNKRGDCDDGAILMANLAVASGIPYWRVRINAGDVPEGGHAYLTYLSDDELKKPVGEQDWKVADWCYYPNVKPFSERPNYKEDDKYYADEIWFSFNQKYAYQKRGTALKRKFKELVK